MSDKIPLETSTTFDQANDDQSKVDELKKGGGAHQTSTTFDQAKDDHSQLDELKKGGGAHQTSTNFDQANNDHSKMDELKKGGAHGDDENIPKVEAFHKKFFGNDNVFVDDKPRISTGSISTFGVSTCYFYLMCGTFEESQFCYLNHNADGYEKTKKSQVLYYILNDIVMTLEKKFPDASDTIIESLKDVYFFVGGGSTLAKDVVREACSLLRNQDERTVAKLKRKFDDDNINNLFDKLFNRTIIMKAISFALSDKEEADASVMDVNQQKTIIEPPSYTLFYSCLLNMGYMTIDFGKEKLFSIACMCFSLQSRSNNDNFVWVIDNQGIETIKNDIGNQTEELKKLEKVLSLIPNNALFDASSSS